MALGALAFFIAHSKAWEHVLAFRALKDAPYATLMSPRDGPAIYTGIVEGPDGRISNDGSKAAAGVWWSVYEEESDDNSKRVCHERHVDDMRLLDSEGNSAPLRMFRNDTPSLVIRTGRDVPWSSHVREVLLDLGDQETFRPSELPSIAQKCAGKDRWFSEGYLPQRSRVEILACFHAGGLERCPGPLPSVMSVGNLSRHLSLRVSEATEWYGGAAVVYTVILIALTLVQFMAEWFRPSSAARPFKC